MKDIIWNNETKVLRINKITESTIDRCRGLEAKRVIIHEDAYNSTDQDMLNYSILSVFAPLLMKHNGEVVVELLNWNKSDE